jgi:tight adherence protein C
VVGSLLVVIGWSEARRARVADRVLPYLRDLAGHERPRARAGARFARVVERQFGGSASVERRLRRAHLATTVPEFRIEQALWGLLVFAAAVVPCSLLAARSPERALPLLGCALAAGFGGALLRENRLTGQVARHERAVLQEFPALAELLALAVAAGEGPAAALTRIVERASGALAAELAEVLTEIRLGRPLVSAFEAYAARSGLAVVARFADGIATAVERGTPLADVLHAQAGDVREAARRALIEDGARREVLMMVPVVFLVLPTVVVFAFWPGLAGLHLVVG